jgi:hypothetical protein
MPRKSTKRGRKLKKKTGKRTKRRTTSLGKRGNLGALVTDVKAKSKRKTIPTEGSAKPHFAVRTNAFSTATQQPKICDGKFTQSLSRRLQNTVQIRNANSATFGNDMMHIIFAPSLGVPLTVMIEEGGKLARPNDLLHPRFCGFPGQTVGYSIVERGKGGTEVFTIPEANTEAQNEVDFALKNLGQFSQWRIVSQGLKLQLVNTDEENDGWWEAVRFNWRRNIRDLSLVPIDGTTDGEVLGVAPCENNLYEYVAGMSMVEQPGYKSGLIRDIDKVKFQNHPQTSSHDPVPIDDKVKFRFSNTDFIAGLPDPSGDSHIDDDVQYDSNTVKLSLKPTANGRAIADQSIDDNMDWIYIRVHCRPNSGNNNQNGSRFVCNYVQNIEMAFDPSSDFAAFQTINKLNKAAAGIDDKINNNQAAADPDSNMSGR